MSSSPRASKGARPNPLPAPAAAAALFMERGPGFLSPETHSSCALREFKWNNLPHPPRPSPTLALLLAPR